MNAMNLKQSRILLIAPYFFGYELEIQRELELAGAEVDFLPDRPYNSSLMKAVTRWKRELVLGHADRFYRSALEKLGRSSYSHILVIQGEGVSPTLLKHLRSSYPAAQLGLYMWDSFRNKRALIPNLPHFDYCLSFDPDDARQHGMQFRPLFFTRGFEGGAATPARYDISFIGTAHSDRYRIVHELQAALPAQTRGYWYLFLQAPWMFWYHKLSNPAFAGARLGDFHYQSLGKEVVHRTFQESRAILDIEHPAQNGLTMRSFEALGARKKLLTTNARIADYDFYDPRNIQIISREGRTRIPDDFFSSGYAELPVELYEKYSLRGWLRDTMRIATAMPATPGAD